MLRRELDRRTFVQAAGTTAAGAAMVHLAPSSARAAPSGPKDMFVVQQPGKGCFPLVSDGWAAPLVVGAEDHPGVVRVADDLAGDLRRVTGVRPRTAHDVPRNDEVVLIGTLGSNPVIDRLAREGKLATEGVAGRWEASLQQVVEDPVPGVRRALVIAGSDPRGTIFGAYEVSRQAGVSPWHWWADVPPHRREALYVLPGRHVQGSPAVRYRGLLINDEDPALGTWVPKHFGPGLAKGHPHGFNHHFYAHVFELLLRLKGNLLWPAVWGRAFAEDDPENHATATHYGVIMGTSHEAPMMRGIEEWNRHAVPAERDEDGRITKPGHDPYGGTGEWSFVHNRQAVEAYWRDGIRRMQTEDFEGLATVGMRGNGDLELGDEGGPDLMKEIIASQRRIITRQTGTAASRTPQVWTVYKEVMEYWKQGLRPPEDVTVVFPDDNWGNLVELPRPDERDRSGGYGLYYHFDYVGDGRNYKWVDTSPLPNVWDQLHQAYSWGIDRMWVVNVGDLKGMERPLQFFLDYAWDPAALPLEEVPRWDREFAAENFNDQYARAISGILTDYTALQARRKPELLNRRITVDPDRELATDPRAVIYDDEASPFSLIHYRELERVTAEWQELAERAEETGRSLPAERRAAYYELVLYRVKATANLYALREAEFTSILYAQQGRTAANEQADRAEAHSALDKAMSRYYNHRLSDGKWEGFQTQSKIGYGDVERYGSDAGWQQPQDGEGKALPDAVHPPPRRVRAPQQAEMGVALEGSTLWWPHADVPAQLPAYSRYQSHPAPYVEVFNRGRDPFPYRITSPEPWLSVSPSSCQVHTQARATVSVAWKKAPPGTTRVPLIVHGAGCSVTVTAVVDNPRLPRLGRKGFVEAGGFVSIEAAHYSRARSTSAAAWRRVPGIGRTGDGMEPFPVTSTRQRAGFGPCLEYHVYLLTAGRVRVTACLSPRNAALPQKGLRYAVSFDDAAPQTVDIVAATGSDPVFLNRQWERNTSDNVNRTVTEHTLAEGGRHTLKFWMVDPTVVLQNLLVDTGGLAESYLGPPESRHLG